MPDWKTERKQRESNCCGDVGLMGGCKRWWADGLIKAMTGEAERKNSVILNEWSDRLEGGGSRLVFTRTKTFSVCPQKLPAFTWIHMIRLHGQEKRYLSFLIYRDERTTSSSNFTFLYSELHHFHRSLFHVARLNFLFKSLFEFLLFCHFLPPLFFF